MFCTACASKPGKTCDRSQPSCGECMSSDQSVCQYVKLLSHFDQEHTDAVSRAFKAIAEEITILHQLSNTIRKASRGARNTDIDVNYVLKNAQGDEIEQDLRSEFAAIVAYEAKHARPQIRERLVETMVARRKRVCYRQEHDRSRSIKMPSRDSPAPIAILSSKVAKRTGSSDTLLSIPGLNPIKVQTQIPRLNQIVELTGSQITASSMGSQQFLRASSPSQVSSSSGRTVAQDSLGSLSFPPLPRMYNREQYKRVKPGIAKNHEQRVDDIRRTETISLKNGMYKGLHFRRNLAAESARYREERKQAKRQCGWGQGSFTCPFCLSLLERGSFAKEARWRSIISFLTLTCKLELT